MTTIEKLEDKANQLRRDLEIRPDPRVVELRELEIAIKVLVREGPQGDVNGSSKSEAAAGFRAQVVRVRTRTQSLFTARPGSAKEFIVGFLREHGPTPKDALFDAFQRAGRPISRVTLSSALSKSGGMFITNGSGIWRLAEPRSVNPAPA